MNAVIKKMSRADKLRTMEQLWTDLTGDQNKYASPSWHFDELARTEHSVESGQMKFVDWEKAKQSIRRRTR